MMSDEYNWEKAWQKPEPAVVIPLPPPVTSNGTSPYGAKALQEELYILANTSEGARNHQLNKSAFNLAQLVAAGHLDSVNTQQQLRATALMTGLPPSEVDGTLRSAFKAGTQLPRQVPELEVSYTVEEVTIQIDPETGEPINPSIAANQTAIDRRQIQIESLYITHEGLAHIKPPTPLIEGWLYRNSLAWLAGKPGDGKSFIALDMAYSVATGTPWQGHTTQQGKVLYIAAEGASGMSIRANAWCMANSNPTQIPITYLPLSLRLINPAEIDVQALLQALQELHPALIIIDTQARVTVGAEENSAKDMGWFIDALETLRRHHPATYLTVHHTPRNGDNLRGSIALEGAAETVLLAVKEGNVVTLKCQKQKNAAEAEDLRMYMQPLGDSIIMSYQAVDLDHEMIPSEKQILETLRDLYDTEEVAATELMEAAKVPKGTWARPIKLLVNKGLVAKREAGNRKWYRLTAKGLVSRNQEGITGIVIPRGKEGITVSPPFKGDTDDSFPESDFFTDHPGLCRICLEPLTEPSDDPDCMNLHPTAQEET